MLSGYMLLLVAANHLIAGREITYKRRSTHRDIDEFARVGQPT